jgi:hypothetical protein
VIPDIGAKTTRLAISMPPICNGLLYTESGVVTDLLVVLSSAALRA